MANTLTTNYSLAKPAHGDSGWDIVINANFDTLDTQLFAVSQSQAQGRTGIVLTDTVTGLAYTVQVTNGVIQVVGV
jgi:hypothetical protein